MSSLPWSLSASFIHLPFSSFFFLSFFFFLFVFFFFPNIKTHKLWEYLARNWVDWVQILTYGRASRWGDADKCKFLSVMEHWSTADCYKHCVNHLSGSLHFCCSEIFAGTDHSSTYCSSLLTASVLACCKGKVLLRCGLISVRLLSSAYFPLPHVCSMQRQYKGRLLLKYSCSLSQQYCC